MGIYLEDRNTILLESVLNQLIESLENVLPVNGENVALNRGMEILEAAIAFCRGQHQTTRDGLSGGYITSVLARALEFDGDLDDLASRLNDHRDELGRLVNRDANFEPRTLLTLFYRLQEFLSKEIVHHELEREPQRWRL